MSSELERRLEAMLAEAPEPDPGAGEEALTRALSALRPVAPPRRGLRTAVLVFAAAVVLLAIAAGSLAGAGALHVSFGTKKAKQRPAITQLVLPKGANGIAAIVDGRLSVVIKRGFRLQGLSATAAALSPHALYIAAGIGHSLVAMAPDGRRAWSHPTGGNVVAIAWAPDGLQIAYVVRTGHRLALHVIYGNGKRDTRIDRSVRAVRPSWRADSLAFAYVAAGGKVVVYDLAHTSRQVLKARASGDVRQVAFAPSGRLLAIATRTEVGILRPGLNQVEARGQIAGVGWPEGSLAVAHGGSRPVLSITVQSQERSIPLSGTITAFEGTRRGVVVALSAPGDTRVLATSGLHLQTVLRLPRRATVGDLQIG
jgi:hypothetical protein